MANDALCAGNPVQHGLDERGRRNARQCNGLAGIGGRVIVLAERVLHRVFRMDGNEVVVAFNNGQRFTVTVEQSA